MLIWPLLLVTLTWYQVLVLSEEPKAVRAIRLVVVQPSQPRETVLPGAPITTQRERVMGVALAWRGRIVAVAEHQLGTGTTAGGEADVNLIDQCEAGGEGGLVDDGAGACTGDLDQTAAGCRVAVACKDCPAIEVVVAKVVVDVGGAARGVDRDGDGIRRGQRAVAGLELQDIRAGGAEGRRSVTGAGVTEGDGARARNLGPGVGQGSRRIGQAVVGDGGIERGRGRQGDRLIVAGVDGRSGVGGKRSR